MGHFDSSCPAHCPLDSLDTSGAADISLDHLWLACSQHSHLLRFCSCSHVAAGLLPQAFPLPLQQNPRCPERARRLTRRLQSLGHAHARPRNLNGGSHSPSLILHPLHRGRAQHDERVGHLGLCSLHIGRHPCQTSSTERLIRGGFAIRRLQTSRTLRPPHLPLDHSPARCRLASCTSLSFRPGGSTTTRSAGSTWGGFAPWRTPRTGLDPKSPERLPRQLRPRPSLGELGPRGYAACGEMAVRAAVWRVRMALAGSGARPLRRSTRHIRSALLEPKRETGRA